MIDNFSRRILAWRLADRFEPANTIAALVEAGQGVASSNEPPTVLVDAGVENVNGAVDELIESGLFRRALAQTELRFSNSMIEAWWRVLKHPWLFLNALENITTLRRLVAFYVEEHDTKLPHSAFQGRAPDEMYYGKGDHVPREIVQASLTARRSRLEINRGLLCIVCVQREPGATIGNSEAA